MRVFWVFEGCFVMVSSKSSSHVAESNSHLAQSSSHLAESSSRVA
jgi:hypothetical protein